MSRCRDWTIALFFLLAAGALVAEGNQTQTTVWDLQTLATDKLYPTTITAQNTSCPGARTLVARVQGANWLRITGPTEFKGLKPGQAQTSEAVVDTRGLAPGYYQGWIRVRCIDCPPPPKCFQDISLVEVILRIPGETTVPDESPGTTPPAPPEELCGTLEVEGRLAPTQVVWQDDPVFEDQPTKQLRQLAPALLEAELDMIQNRRTLLFGTIRPVGAKPEDKRKTIFLRGRAQGSGPVAVKVRFFLSNGGPRRLLWESGVVARIPLAQPCKPGRGKSFEAEVRAEKGLPPDSAFTFPSPGGYTLTAELVTEAGTPTGIRTMVLGDVVATKPPRVVFEPIVLAPQLWDDKPYREGLHAATRALERASRVRLPDWYPVATAALDTSTLQARLVQPTAADRAAIALFNRKYPGEDQGARMRFVMSESIKRQLQSGALLAGVDRIVAVLGKPDFDRFRTGAIARAGAFTNSQKVVFIDKDVSGHTFTVAHELAHTLPFAWTSRQIERECKRNFHNNDNEKVAWGFEITEDTKENRRSVDGIWPVMGRSHKERHGITQCTYWHLLKQLVEGPPDPPVILVQGYVGQGEGGPEGILLPAYQVDGIADLEEGKSGDWAIELRSRKGKKVARYPFVPIFEQPHGAERRVISFVYRVPDDRPEVGRIDLLGPQGRLASLTYSENAPRVEISPPRPEEGRLRLDWSGSDADGDELLYSVLYSSDGGETWATLAWESSETSFEIELDEDRGEHAARVIVTDGARSGESRVDFP